MKKIYTILLAVLLLGGASTAFALPYYRTEQSILPFLNSTYYLGTSSPSTQAWKAIYADQICLTADVCRTVLTGGGGGSGGGTWATTTSSVTNRFINYPLNTTDIPCIGGTATSTCKTYFDPNTNINQINGILNIGSSVPPQSTGFGTNGGKYQLHFSTSTNDVAGADFYNIDPGIEAAAGVFFQNNKSPLGGIGLAQTYYGGVIFSGGGWNGAALGVGALPANSLGVYASDGALVLGSATSTGHIDFITGPSSFSSGAVDATLLNNGNWGIGTTSPYARLSITNATLSTSPAFAISTSTLTATSTAFTVDSNGFVGIGTSTPRSQLSIGNDNGINFTTATSTFNGTQGGINIKSGCYAINGTCTGLGSGSGSVTSVATNNGLTGGTITTTGTLGLDLSKLGSANQNLLLSWNGSQLVASGTPNITTGWITATTTSTSTFVGGVQANILNTTSSTASSTFANGTNLTAGCYAIIGNCLSHSNLAGNVPVAQGGTGSTTLGGVLAGNGASGVKSAIIGTGLAWDGTTLSSTGGGGGAGTYPFTPSTNFGANTNATTGVVWFQNGLQASTTSQFDAINVLNATTTNRQIVGANLGIATSTPGTPLSVTGAGVFTDQVEATNFFATSTTATSSFNGGFKTNTVAGRGIEVTGGTAPNIRIVAGPSTGNGFNTLIQGSNGNAGGFLGGPVTINGGVGTSGSGNGHIILQETRNGGFVGISTTSPYRTLSVAGDAVVDNNILSSYFISTSTTVQNIFPLLSVTTATTTANSFIGGNLGIGTSTPGTPLGVTGAGVFTGQVEALNFYATSTTATSTFLGQISGNRVTAATARFTGLVSCDTIDSDLYGNLVCGTDATGAGGSVTGNGITGMMTAWSSGSNIIGTSTIIGERFVATSTTAASSTIPNLGLTNLSVSGNAEIGVPRYPWLSGMLLSVDSTGLTEATGTPTAGFFNATSTTASSTLQGLESNLLHVRSTTASSTFENGINLTKGCFAINSVCITGGAASSASTTLLSTDSNTFFGATTTFNLGLQANGYTNFAGTTTLITNTLHTVENKIATGTTMNIDWGKGNFQTVNISTSAITLNFTNPTYGDGLSLLVCNQSSGTAGTITWGSLISWPGGIAPGQTTTANQCDLWSWRYSVGTSTATVGSAKYFLTGLTSGYQ